MSVYLQLLRTNPRQAQARFHEQRELKPRTTKGRYVDGKPAPETTSKGKEKGAREQNYYEPRRLRGIRDGNTIR